LKFLKDFEGNSEGRFSENPFENPKAEKQKFVPESDGYFFSIL